MDFGTVGEEILNTLFDHQEQRTFVYEHVWRPNDVLLWQCSDAKKLDPDPTI